MTFCSDFLFFFFFFNDTATTEIYTLSLHDALPICCNNLFPSLIFYRLFSRKVTCDSEPSKENDEEGHTTCDDQSPPKLSSTAKVCMLTKFMLPLVITHVVPDIAEQVNHL